MKQVILLSILFLGFFCFDLFAEDVKNSAPDNSKICNLLVLGKFKDAKNESDDPELKKAIDSLFTLNEKVAKTYQPFIGKNITLDVGGLPLSGTLLKIDGSKLYMKLKRGKGSVVLPVKASSIPLDKRLQKVKLPPLASNLCLGAKFFRQKNYQGAMIFFSKTGALSDGLQKALLKQSKYFIPLFKACKEGNISEIEELIKKGGDINNSCSAMVFNPRTKQHKLTTSTLLMETIKCKQPEVVKYLVNHGVDVNKENSEGVTPLMLAIMVSNDNLNLVDFLLQHKADIEHKDLSGNTPLSGAVAMGKKSAVKSLIENGANLDNPTSKGYTPVMIAVMANRPEILQMLLDAGADINKPHPKKWTVFMLDRSRMDPRIRRILDSLAPAQPKKKKSQTSFPGVDVIR